MLPITRLETDDWGDMYEGIQDDYQVPLLLEYDHVQPFLLHIRELPHWSHPDIEVHGLAQYVHVLAGAVLANSPHPFESEDEHQDE